MTPATVPSDHIMAVYSRTPLAFERGEGVWLVATNGERYLDFGSGIAVSALGHAHPYLVAALRDDHIGEYYALLAAAGELEESATKLLSDVEDADMARALDAAAGRETTHMFFERGGRIYSTDFMIR